MKIGALASGLLDLLFPWGCAVCKVAFEGRGPLCAPCSAKLTALEAEPSCAACATSLPMHGNPCPYCMGKAPPNFERVLRLTAFHDPTRALIHHLKYHRRWGVGEELADRLLAREPIRDLLAEIQVLVPVPLHWRRQVIRGYNQADVLARRLCRKHARVIRAVKRVRNTEQQTNLHSAARRAENLRGAFKLIAPEKITGKHVAVIDDVWTTGATMQEVARVLKQAKPASLSAIVIARTDPKGLERADKRPRGTLGIEDELDF